MHDIPSLVKRLNIKLWQLECVVPLVDGRNTDSEHLHYTVHDGRLLAFSVLRKFIGW